MPGQKKSKDLFSSISQSHPCFAEELLEALCGKGGPSKQDEIFFTNNKGRVCKILNTGHQGILYELNRNESGVYPGSRYPFCVKITATENKAFKHVIGEVFEYTSDCIRFID